MKVASRENKIQAQSGESPAAITRAGMHAFKQSLGILGTCIAEAPEFASRKRRQQPKSVS